MSIVKRLLGLKESIPARELRRNERCWCGSGKKYKHCHLESDERKKAAQRAAGCVRFS